ncbi:MAG: GyrI-like domain-containing protein [FCB group bacterium]|nr:GyrI-like domain-containing protein [FCB group bacterium]
MKTKLALFLAIIFLMGCGKKFEEYEYLSDPQISEKAPQKMLVYEAAGNPNETVGEAFGALISTFFKLKKSHDMDMTAPRARWPKAVDTPKDQWVGIYAIPVAETVTEIPDDILSEHPALKLETWEYGLVAEILHKGSYASEGPTVKRLHEFITESGYEISGLHEEEYLKGPGMFGPGNPDKYFTIIRYPVAEMVAPVVEPSSESIETEVTEG